MNIRNKFPCLLIAISLSLQNSNTSASTVIGVTGANGDGSLDSYSFYEIDTVDGSTVKMGNSFDTDPSAGVNYVNPNQLAYDDVNQNYYYMDHTGTSLYRFDIATGNNFFLADLATVQNGITGRTGSGGGDFYNGRYYYAPENPDPDKIYVVSFNLDGSQFVSHQEISPFNLVGGTLGNFGDFAINSDSGILYGSSVLTNGNYALWSVDLNLSSSDYLEFNIINDQLDDVYQIAFDDDGELWANEWQSNGNLYRIETDPLSADFGNIVTSDSLTNGQIGGDFYDLASNNARSGMGVLPEPSSIGFSAIGGGVLLMRRHRKYSRASHNDCMKLSKI